MLALMLPMIILSVSSWAFLPSTQSVYGHGFAKRAFEQASSIGKMPLMKGMTINAWSAEAYNSSSFDQSLSNLAGIKANWVTFTIFWFMNTSSDTQMSPRPDLYTASDSSLIHAIQRAHELDLAVALKPMVDVADGTWRGQISPSNWTLWFQNYRTFINYYSDIAQANDVELFTVGTELRSSQSYTSEWRSVISQARTHFSRNMTYAANWDTWVPGAGYGIGFWNDLDYVGADGYFPLTNSYNPTLTQLISAWSYCTASGWWGTGRNWTNELYSTYTQTGKSIIFTEIGYTSQNGTNTQPWTWNVSPTLDLQEQADCYEAALKVFKEKPWFMGWFWWAWETNPNAGGPCDKDYTPQNKPAQTTLYQYYSSRTVTFQAATVNVPVTVNYTCNGTSGTLTIPVAGSNTTAVPYGSTLHFNYTSDIVDGGGIRYALTQTNPNSPLINVTDDTIVTANYTTSIHDVAITNLNLGRTVVGQGLVLNFTVTVGNRGNFPETFNVTASSNSTPVGTQKIDEMPNNTLTTITFTWNTTPLAYGDYTISASASLVPNEANTTNNNFDGGSVKVTIPGDIDGNYRVQLADLVLLASAYGSKSGDPRWNPNADIDNSGMVGLSDLVILAQHYGQHYP
jgi:hypothetical protein